MRSTTLLSSVACLLALGCGQSSYPVATTAGGTTMGSGNGGAGGGTVTGGGGGGGSPQDAGVTDGGTGGGGFGGGTTDGGNFLDGGTFVDGGIAASPGLLLIESNESTGNAIIAFRRAADGALSEMPQGRVMTGGNGVAPDSTQSRGPFEADQQLVLTPDHRYVLAVNTGSDSISVMQFTSAGILKPVAGSPFWSGGHNPVSLAVIPGHVVVANKACDGTTQPNYALLSLGADGSLAVFNSKQQRLPMGASPSIAYVAPGGHQLFGTEFYDQSRQDLAREWQIDAYAIDSQGSMTHAPNAPYAVPPLKFIPVVMKPPALALNLVAHPLQNLLYVGFVNQDRLGVYSFDDLGALTPVALTKASAAQWPAFFRVDQSGRYLYSSNNLSGSVSTWDLSQPRAPVEKSVLALLGSRSGTPFVDSEGNVRTFSSEPYQLSLDESGQHLYVLSQRVTTNAADRNGNMLHVLDVGVAGLLDERVQPIELSTLGLDPYARPAGVLVVPMK